MDCYLVRMRTKGIKCLEDEIILNFYPVTIGKKMSSKMTRVKAIYGMNGSGKSSIMNAVDIYMDLNSIKNFMTQKPKVFYEEMFNKKLKYFYCEMTYALVYKDSKEIFDVYSHYVEIASKDEGAYEIVKESLSRLLGKSLNSEFEKIYETNNGVLNFFDEIDCEYKNRILDSTKNLLSYNTLISLLDNDILWDILKENNNDFIQMLEKYDTLSSFLNCILFQRKLNVHIDSSDIHDLYFNSFSQELIRQYSDMDANKIKNDIIESIRKPINSSISRVHKSRVKEYEHSINKLEKFIKIFKPTLKHIELDKKIDGDYYRYSKIMVYNNYKIDSEFESTGIKRLIEIFSYFVLVQKGEIVFIDELDANIHGKYLGKLLEYFAKNSQGQLCFTTHSLETMNILAKYKNSLNFLGEDKKIFTWANNGHYLPLKLYLTGKVPGSPMNVEDFDFINVFQSEE